MEIAAFRDTPFGQAGRNHGINRLNTIRIELKVIGRYIIMKLIMKATVRVLLLGLMLLSSGCGSGTSQTPIPGQSNEQTPTPSTPVSQTTNVAVYYLKSTDNEFYLVHPGRVAISRNY
jgi:hypothetical protein